jgi:hydroxyacylglutathione hydrolase
MKIWISLWAAFWLMTSNAWPQAQSLSGWSAGSEDCSAPQSKAIEARHYAPDTVVIRQNPCIDAEANVIYLLTGNERSLLIDSGAVEDENGTLTANYVRSILQTAGAQARPLTVAHTHGHQDHRHGDEAFARQPNTQIVPIDSDALRAFFGFRDWPNDIVQIDLGNRIVDLIPAPGHHQDHIVFYDRNTRLLFTGDFLLPGRLLVQDIDAYRASAARVVEFARTHPVVHVLGAHIELDANGDLYPWGTTWHPNERALPLAEADLLALPQALEDFNGFYSRHPNYTVVNPIHNLIAQAAGAILVIVLLVWVARRLWKRRRASA